MPIVRWKRVRAGTEREERRKMGLEGLGRESAKCLKYLWEKGSPASGLENSELGAGYAKYGLGDPGRTWRSAFICKIFTLVHFPGVQNRTIAKGLSVATCFLGSCFLSCLTLTPSLVFLSSKPHLIQISLLTLPF